MKSTGPNELRPASAHDTPRGAGRARGKGTRLVMRRGRGREPRWYVVWRGRPISTCCTERNDAERYLAAYRMMEDSDELAP
jgi:hypothetical protein